jgi:hypothetical protein
MPSLRVIARASAFVGLVSLTLGFQPARNIQVQKKGNPVAKVDIFLYANQGKQRLGSTGSEGILGFDPSLLTGKRQVETYVRECPDRTELILVPADATLGEEDKDCRDSNENSEDDCSCYAAGIWIPPYNALVVDLRSAPVLDFSNPIVLGGTIGAAAVTTLVVASGGGDSSSSTFAPPPSTATGSSDPVIVAITPDGAYALVEVTVVEDEAPHHIWVRLDQATGFNVETMGNNIYFRGNPPWVDVMGPFNSTTGAFTATGSGVVAGYNNVSVHFEGTASNDAVSGYVIMGAAGELPGGQYIKYFVRATQTSQ